MKLAMLLLALFFSGGQIDNSKTCDLEVEVEIDHSSDDKSNGRVEVTVDGGVEPYTYVFFDEKGHPVSLNNKSPLLENVASETYYCTVIDANGCQKKVKIEVL